MYMFMRVTNGMPSLEFTACTKTEAMELACIRFKIPRPSHESNIAETSIGEACVRAKCRYEEWQGEPTLTVPFTLPRLDYDLFVQYM